MSIRNGRVGWGANPSAIPCHAGVRTPAYARSGLSTQHSGLKQAGASLVELVVFIVIVSVALAGVLLVFNLTTSHSADPLIRKQALAIAEALLEEVELMPFTDCDPDSYDPVAGTCAPGGTETMGPETGETRGSLTTAFDNVNDYNNFCLGSGFPAAWTCSSSASSDIGGAAGVTVPTGYSAIVAVAQDAAFGPAGSRVPVADALRITVTVAYNNGNDSITLEAYRIRYEPNP